MTHLSIAIPPALQQGVDSRLAEGGYADAADYLRDLVRRDRAQSSEDRQWLKAMIDEGLASGVIDRASVDVLDEIIGEDHDLRG